ncbi:MAG TPA: methyltransferase domain-containing protein [Actinomycetota bacterium]|nr:methyltransferase domain-containing protein [Actinomycetota bacterium]
MPIVRVPSDSTNVRAISRAEGGGISATETFQISIERAEAYEAQLVPALFEEWAGRLVVATGVSPGHRVLDVACGTGIVARTAAGPVGGGGNVVGLDLNEEMLTVARRVRPDLEWRQGDAARLPFPDRSTSCCVSRG